MKSLRFNTVRTKGADLKDEFLFQILAASVVPRCHVFFGVVRQIKMASDWLRCILVILLNIANVFAESVT